MLQTRKTKFCASDGRPPGPCRTVYEGRQGRRGRVRGRLAGWKYQVGLCACAAVTHRANAACAAGSAEDPPANANVHGYDERPPPPSGGVTVRFAKRSACRHHARPAQAPRPPPRATASWLADKQLACSSSSPDSDSNVSEPQPRTLLRTGTDAPAARACASPAREY